MQQDTPSASCHWHGSLSLADMFTHIHGHTHTQVYIFIVAFQEIPCRFVIPWLKFSPEMTPCFPLG